MNNSIILPGINTPITPESEKFRRAIAVRDFCGQVGTNEIEQVNQLAREKFGACGLEYLLAELVAMEKLGSASPDGALPYLIELVGSLDAAYISSWQSTAGWQPQLDAAKKYLEARS